VKDPYEVLGVGRDATPEEVKGAFRKLAQKHHPDRNPDDPNASQRFKEINAAHQILSDPKKREMFDRFGAPGAGGTSPFQGVPFDFSEINFDGLFGDLLGALGIKVGRDAALQKELRLTFEEAAFGCTKELAYDRVEPCTDCHGSGSSTGIPETCATCKGRGRVRLQQGVLPISIERPCQACKGTGRIVTNPCKTCHGPGVVSKSRTIEVTIPPGTENGATKMVERGGNYTRADRAAGDLELVIRVTPHEFFRRVGDDVVCTLPISFPLAALGGEVEVPTLDGRGKLRVPPGTQPGTVLRVRGKGIPRRVIQSRGDQLVEVAVEVPRALSPEQRAIIEQLAAAVGQSIKPVSPTPSFLDRLKNLFSPGSDGSK
jgi:molecular chaperone DnaJ